MAEFIARNEETTKSAVRTTRRFIYLFITKIVHRVYDRQKKQTTKSGKKGKKIKT